jgi:hypothetical protein
MFGTTQAGGRFNRSLLRLAAAAVALFLVLVTSVSSSNRLLLLIQWTAMR